MSPFNASERLSLSSNFIKPHTLVMKVLNSLLNHFQATVLDVFTSSAIIITYVWCEVCAISNAESQRTITSRTSFTTDLWVTMSTMCDRSYVGRLEALI